jgi:SAM-dependent methyltransferase
MDEHFQANLALWNEWTGIHAASKFYDLPGFKAGHNTLADFELAEVGPVQGKTLLHLQCHFGMTTLSWARLGAQATGMDFSDQAIALARTLSQELKLPAEFICCNLYDLPQHLTGQFDVVYTSFGVLTWLPDLPRWAQIVAQYLKPGGVFYLAETHPLAMIFDDNEGVTDFRLGYSYFYSPEPLVCEVQGSYADRTAQVKQRVTYEWTHSLSDILNALLAASLRLEFLHEWPFALYEVLPDRMVCGDDGFWRLKEHPDWLPLTFSLRATK